jgi:hypothetical protein
MAALVELLCPQPPEIAGVAPDPMPDLEAAEQLRQAGRARARAGRDRLRSLR